jgi:hypothetical protein
MATPGTKSVTLSDGSVGEIPANLDPASETAYIARLDAANKPAQPTSTWDAVSNWLNKTPAQAISDADTASGGAISNAASAVNRWTGGVAAPTANMAGNVFANVAGLPWDAPAAISNAITHTARNYGYLKGPEWDDIPYAAPVMKQSLGVTPSVGPVSSRVENALTIASTGGEGLFPRLVKGTVGEGLSEGGNLVGQKIAENTDPRLSPVLQLGGALTATGAPYEQGFSVLLSRLRGKDAGSTYDAAIDTQDAINAANPNEPMTRPPITTGMVGSPLIKQVERAFGAVPILGQGIDSARENAVEGMTQARDLAAKNVGATPTDTTATAPGSALKYGTEGYLKDVSQRMDNIENGIANNTQGPGGGAALIDVHPLLDRLEGMKTMTDAAGNVRPNVSPGLRSMIDDEIANINSARTEEEPGLNQAIQTRIDAANQALNNTTTPPNAQQAQVLQSQIQQMRAMQDANLKVPFNVLRQMKTQQGYTVNPGTGLPTLNGHMGGKVLDAYRDTIQDHVNGLDPQLGTTYQGLNDEYKVASNASRAIGNSDERSLTSMLQRGLGAPSAVEDVSKTPAWGPAAGNTIRQQGMNTKGEFVPRDFAGVWDNVPLASKQLYTQTSPDAARTLDNVSQLARNYNIPPQTGGGSKALAALAFMDKALETVGLKGALAAMPLGYLGQSMPTIRVLAGRPQNWLQSLQDNIPALMAVARNQAQNNPLGQ